MDCALTGPRLYASPRAPGVPEPDVVAAPRRTVAIATMFVATTILAIIGRIRRSAPSPHRRPRATRQPFAMELAALHVSCTSSSPCLRRSRSLARHDRAATKRAEGAHATGPG